MVSTDPGPFRISPTLEPIGPLSEHQPISDDSFSMGTICRLAYLISGSLKTMIQLIAFGA